MNQLLETEPGDEATSDQEQCAAAVGLESAFSTIGAADEPVQNRECDLAAEKGLVLLLEDDPSFREIIRECLAENGYSVVAVQNGGEGVREVLARDFALVLCDFMMPGLPGDMFYRAVERLRPALCERFIFMTGHQGDAGTNDFIKAVNGFVLRKPFSFKQLFDAIALADVRRTFQSLFTGVPGDPNVLAASRSVDDLIARAAPGLHDSVVEKILARARADATGGPKSDTHAPSEPEVRPAAGSGAFVLGALALSLVLIAGLWKPYWEARDRIAAVSANHLPLEGEWTATSRKLQKALATQSKIEMFQMQLDGVSAERAKPRWVPALRSVAACAGAGIQMREVRASEKSGDEKMWTLVVGGVSTGADPRAIAERYRTDLQADLDRIFPGGVSIGFEQFEDLPDTPSGLPGERRGAFRVIAKIRFEGQARTESKGGA